MSLDLGGSLTVLTIRPSSWPRGHAPDPAAGESLLEQLVMAGALRIVGVQHLDPGRVAVTPVEIRPVLPLADDPLEVHAADGNRGR